MLGARGDTEGLSRMRNLCTVLTALFFVLFSVGRVVAQTPTVQTLVRAGRMLDPRTGHLLLDIIVPPEAEIARHFNGEFAPGLLLAVVESPTKRVLLGAQLAREDLESGFTTIRNLGHSGIDGDTALRGAINPGRVPG